jgi:hypothetical protein
VRERTEIDQDRRQVALLAEHGRDLVLHLPERRDQHPTILFRGSAGGNVVAAGVDVSAA